jgi:hypothetical protein
MTGGTFTVGSTPTDFSDAIESMTFIAEAAVVDVPATLATPESSRAGSRKYSVTIKYFSNDVSSTNELFRVLLDELMSGDGEVPFAAQFHAGAVSTTNPKYSGTLIVTRAAIGGDVGTLSDDAVTFSLKAAPTIATS